MASMEVDSKKDFVMATDSIVQQPTSAATIPPNISPLIAAGLPGFQGFPTASPITAPSIGGFGGGRPPFRKRHFNPKWRARGPLPKKSRKAEVINILARDGESALGEKNPLQFINEMSTGAIEFKETSSHPPGASPLLHNFVITATVAGEEFQGSARNKKDAKQGAGKQVVTRLIEISQIVKEGGEEVVKQKPEYETFLAAFGVSAKDICDEDSKNTTSDEAVRASFANSPDANPISLLNQHCQSVDKSHQRVNIEFVGMEGSSPNTLFHMSVTLQDQTFKGYGASKRIARIRCAQAALKGLFNVDSTWLSQHYATMESQVRAPDPELDLPETVADRVAEAVHGCWIKLMPQASSFTNLKVLSGVVMTQGTKENVEYTVIAVTTGTKMIFGNHLSDTGVSVHDCHAEVIGRRALTKYLIDQCMASSKNQDSIFIKTKQQRKTKFKLKDDVKFHLYISSAPCGDSRLFAPHEVSKELQKDTKEFGDVHPLRRSRGLLRTKIESGEGTIPIPEKITLTWDGIMGGQRQMSQSCSDKILKWNLLGVQGSLLAQLLVQPIYFTSVISGSLYNYDHQVRALYERGASLKFSCEANFSFHMPFISGISVPEERFGGRSASYSVNWFIGEESPEVLEASTGKVTGTGVPSR